MDYDDDDFDPDSHTAEEIAAHDFERLEHLFNTNPQVREVYYLGPRAGHPAARLGAAAARRPRGPGVVRPERPVRGP